MVKFKTPDNFGALLSSQDYGPTTQLISDDVRYTSFNVISYLIVCVCTQEFSQKAWDPKVQVPFKVESGKTPRRVEIER